MPTSEITMSAAETSSGFTPEQLVEWAGNTTLTTNNLTRQMGLVVSRVDGHDKAIAALQNDVIAIKQSKRVERSQALRLRRAIHSRVNYLLKIKKEGGRVADECIEIDKRYRSGFISRCYHDARTHSKLGTPYTETLKVDFNEVLAYIESWIPEVDGGVEGYKHYLDMRHEERAA